MLEIVFGRAGSGKTSYVYDRIREKANRAVSGIVLLVPEQHSHDAERQMCKVCGDSISLYGEVLSFSRLCNRVFSKTAAASKKILDNGGRILVMDRAFENVAPMLRIYGTMGRKVEFLESLLSIVDEMKASCITASDLFAASSAAGGTFSGKLNDLAFILDSYDSCIIDGAIDPADRLTRLSELIGDSDIGSSIYIDGFIDFTVQEERIIERIIRKGLDVTMCFTCDSLLEGEDVFKSSREAVHTFLRVAEECGIETKITEMQPERGNHEIQFLEENLFSIEDMTYNGEAGAIELFCGETPDEECEFAAAKILELVRGGYRFRDIAVVARGFEDYESLIENIFRKYEIPLFISRKADILQKPPIALITSVFEILSTGWEYDAVFRYLKTWLTGIDTYECDILENYVIKWQIRGSLWTREEDWTFGGEGADEKQRQADINRLRKTIVRPIVKLQNALKSAETASGQITALYDFLEEINLPDILQKKAENFLKSGNNQLYSECTQLWQIIKTALEQFYAILGSMPSYSMQEFKQLWKTLLSQYDIGVIPVSLDSVAVGDISRLRRSSAKCQIILGATDDVMPKISSPGGMFSDDDRDELLDMGVNISDTSEKRINRELSLIYMALTLAKERLIITYPRTSTSGAEKRPSFVASRVKELFGLPVQGMNLEEYRTAAIKPCFELAMVAEKEHTAAHVAMGMFERVPEFSTKLSAALQSINMPRGKLSRAVVEKLYGNELNMSASRVDKYNSCKFAFFMRYGLAAMPRVPAEFDAPEAGTFMHFILENVTRDIKNTDGFINVEESVCRSLTSKYVEEYVDIFFDGLKDKSSRFKYLFFRLAKDAEEIVLEMVRELRVSKFEPIDFELSFRKDGELPPILISDGMQSLYVNGFVDRVDGWVHDDKLYLRVVDYKTGRKTFDISNIWHGMDMQMLIYLFALERGAGERYGREIVPAGVLYVPARDVVVSASRNATDDEIEKLRNKQIKRNGLILNDEDVISAMATDEEKKYLPVRLNKDGKAVGDSLASMERFRKLSSHIDKTLLKLASELQCGDIPANPYYRGPMDNACLYCEYWQVCHFDAEKDRPRYLEKLKNEDAWEKIVGDTDAE